MGLADLAGAAPLVVALSDHQSARALFVAEQGAIDRYRRDTQSMSSRPAILVTGGAGYIGSHCCRALDAAGYQPVIYDNLLTGHRGFAAGRLVVGDIADKATL